MSFSIARELCISHENRVASYRVRSEAMYSVQIQTKSPVKKKKKTICVEAKLMFTVNSLVGGNSANLLSPLWGRFILYFFFFFFLPVSNPNRVEN